MALLRRLSHVIWGVSHRHDGLFKACLSQVRGLFLRFLQFFLNSLLWGNLRIRWCRLWSLNLRRSHVLQWIYVVRVLKTFTCFVSLKVLQSLELLLMSGFVGLSLYFGCLKVVLRCLLTLVVGDLVMLHLVVKLLLHRVVLNHLQLLFFKHYASQFDLVDFVRVHLHDDGSEGLSILLPGIDQVVNVPHSGVLLVLVQE